METQNNSASPSVLNRPYSREELAKALDHLFDQVENARPGLEITSGQAEFLLTELLGKGYTPGQFSAAREWILFGNWKFRNSKQLLGSDFFPTREELSDLRQPGYALVKISEIDRRDAEIFREGVAYASQGKNSTEGTQGGKNAHTGEGVDIYRSALSDANRVLLEAKTEIAALKEALEPFARLYRADHSGEDESRGNAIVFSRYVGPLNLSIRVSHLRTAHNLTQRKGK